MFPRKGRKHPFRKKLHALLINAKLMVQRVGFCCSQVCQSLAWGREQDHIFWGPLHGVLEGFPWAAGQRLAAWKVHTLRELHFLLWLCCSPLEWIIGADTWGGTGRVDAVLYIRYYSWKNKFVWKKSPVRVIQGIYWGIMWEVYLVHQVAPIIFPYLPLFSGSFSPGEREGK